MRQSAESLRKMVATKRRKNGGLFHSLRWYAMRAGQKVYESKRDRRLRTAYGISELEYDSILLKQHETCALCGRSPKRRGLYVDHDHITGRVRGLLCPPCNTLLGHLEHVGMSRVGGYLLDEE